MQILAQHPIAPHACLPYVGRPVVAVMQNGESICGIMERVHDGHLVLRPIDGARPPVAVYNVKMKKSLRSLNRNVATTKAYGPGWGRPYGWGYGNYGWGLGWWWVFPLFWLAAIAAFAFAW